MEIQKGKIINDAFDILKRTFKEINRLKDDVAELLTDYDSHWKFYGEHSAASSTLILKHHHSFFFTVSLEETEPEVMDEYEFFVLTCIFQNEWILKRFNLKDQPELWAYYFKVKNRDEKCNKWIIYDHLNFDRRKYFADKDVGIGGRIFEYRWVDEKSEEEEKEEWEGQFIGYPLVEITNRDVIKEKIMDKLFEIVLE
jgi:hypothetical protein